MLPFAAQHRRPGQQFQPHAAVACRQAATSCSAGCLGAAATAGGAVAGAPAPAPAGCPAYTRELTAQPHTSSFPLPPSAVSFSEVPAGTKNTPPRASAGASSSPAAC